MGTGLPELQHERFDSGEVALVQTSDPAGLFLALRVEENRSGNGAIEAESAGQIIVGTIVDDVGIGDLELFGDVTWLNTSGPAGYGDLELEPDDFDLIFAYPWPGEEQVIFDLFGKCAAVGALLLTYHGQDGLRLQRKVKR